LDSFHGGKYWLLSSQSNNVPGREEVFWGVILLKIS
jgi:hypothetical protein